MMKIRKEQLINKIIGQSTPSISIPYIDGNTAPNSTFNNFKSSTEWAIKSYVDSSITLVLQELYTTEDLEDDLGLNKPK